MSQLSGTESRGHTQDFSLGGGGWTWWMMGEGRVGALAQQLRDWALHVDAHV